MLHCLLDSRGMHVLSVSSDLYAYELCYRSVRRIVGLHHSNDAKVDSCAAASAYTCGFKRKAVPDPAVVVSSMQRL